MEGKKEIIAPERGSSAKMEGDKHGNEVLWAGVFGVKLADCSCGLERLGRQGGKETMRENSWIFEQQRVHLSHRQNTAS